jgi:hypothetical protein
MVSLISRLAIAGQEIVMMPINHLHSLRFGRPDRPKKKKRGKSEFEEEPETPELLLDQGHGSAEHNSGGSSSHSSRNRGDKNTDKSGGIYSGIESIPCRSGSFSGVEQTFGGISTDSSPSKVDNSVGTSSGIDSIPCMCSCGNLQNDICELHSNYAVTQIPNMPNVVVHVHVNPLESVHSLVNSVSSLRSTSESDFPVSVHDMSGSVMRLGASGDPVIIDDERHSVEKDDARHSSEKKHVTDEDTRLSLERRYVATGDHVTFQSLGDSLRSLGACGSVGHEGDDIIVPLDEEDWLESAGSSDESYRDDNSSEVLVLYFHLISPSVVILDYVLVESAKIHSRNKFEEILLRLIKLTTFLQIFFLPYVFSSYIV